MEEAAPGAVPLLPPLALIRAVRALDDARAKVGGAASGEADLLRRLLCAAVVQFPIQARKAALGCQGDGGMGLAHWAAYCGDGDLLEACSGAGAVMESHNREGLAPLHLAAYRGHTAAVRRLLGLGLDIGLRTMYRGCETALELAWAEEGAAAVAEVLLGEMERRRLAPPDRVAWEEARGNGHRCTDLILAAWGRRRGIAGRPTRKQTWAPERVAALLADRTDRYFAWRELNGWTALHVAAFADHTAIVAAYAARGLPLDARGNAGDTALHRACDSGSSAAAELLLTEGCAVDLVDSFGRLPVWTGADSTSVPRLLAAYEKRWDPRRHREHPRRVRMVVRALLALGRRLGIAPAPWREAMFLVLGRLRVRELLKPNWGPAVA